MPCVSVIITTHNRCKLLPRAIESVLAQSFSDYELIVIDDASTDATLMVVDPYISAGVKYRHIEVSKGANHARNAGLNMAKGEYIAFLDDDDKWRPNKLELQVEALKADKDISLVGCWFSCGRKTAKLPKVVDQKLLLSGNFIGSFSNCMFRRKTSLAIGGMDENLQNSQDWDIWLKLSNLGKIAVIQECLVDYNVSDANCITNGRDPKDYYSHYIYVVKQYEEKMGYLTRKRHYMMAKYHSTPNSFRFAKVCRAFLFLLTHYIERVALKSRMALQ